METLRRRFLVTVSLFMLMVTFLFVPMTGRADDGATTEPTVTPPTEWEEQPTVKANVLDATSASCTISSKEDLYGLNAWIKNNSNTNLTIDLTDNIVVNDVVINEQTNEFGVYLWIPINASCNITFNGNGYTISGLYFNDSTRSNVGLFGACEGSVKVSKLGIINSYFNGNSNVGAFAGTLDNGSAITECYSQSIVKATDENTAGGIVAFLQGDAKVSSCYNTGNVACVAIGNVENSCYVANASGLDASYNGTGSVALTEEEFRNGAAAYVLSGGYTDKGVSPTTAWGQKLTKALNGEGAETLNKSYPVFSDDKVYKGKASCIAAEETYINGVIDNYHANVEKHAAKEATCNVAGNREYYICNDCGNIVELNEESGIFEDVKVEEGAEAPKAEDFTIAALGHDVSKNPEQYNKFLFTSKTSIAADGTVTHSHVYHFICTVCGEVVKVAKPAGDETVTEADAETKEVYEEVVDASTAVKRTSTGVECLGITTTYYCAECGYEEAIAQEGVADKHKAVVYCTPTHHWTMCSECKTILNGKEAHDKNITTEAKEPTCDNDGCTEGSECSICHRVLATSQTIPKFGHDWGEWKITKPATCTEAGTREHTCYTCNKTESEEIPATGHTEVNVAEVPAGCETDGVSAGIKCSVCGATIRGCTPITKLGHHFVTDAAVAPTCTLDGLTEGSHCDVCGKVEKAQEVDPATGHTETHEGMEEVAATCTTAGLTEGTKCSVCGTILVAQQEIPAAHTPVTRENKAATCTEAGWSLLVECSVCGEVITKVEIPALNHDLVDDAEVPATCTTTGKAAGQHCTRCDYKTGGEEIPALGHDIVEDKAVAPKCEEVGHEAGTHCTRCDYKTGGAEIAALGHDIVDDEAIPAECGKAGKAAGTHCTRCDYTTGGEEIPALEHKYEFHVAVAATCTTPGTKQYSKCTLCQKYLEEGYTDENIVIPALGHDWQTIARVEPTCTIDGHKEYQHCTRCGEDSMTAEERKLPKHHTEEIIPAVAATCTTPGLTEGIRCSVCGTVIKAQESVDVIAHKFDKVVEAVAPTCTKPGHKEYKVCSVCGAFEEGKTEADFVVEATGHNFNANNADMGWAYDEANGITATVVLHCENENCTEVFNISRCTVTATTNENGQFVVTGKFKYLGKDYEKTLTFDVKEELSQTNADINVAYTFTEVTTEESNPGGTTEGTPSVEADTEIRTPISFTKTSAATREISETANTITYTASTTINGVTFTTTKVFDMGNINYSWSNTSAGYELVTVINGKTPEDGTLRLVTAGTESEEFDEDGVAIKTIYTAKVQVGDYVIATKTKEIAKNLKYTITVVEGSFADGSTSKEVAYGELVTLQHRATEYGEYFTGWQVDGVIVNINDTYSFYAKKDVTVTATFGVEAPEVKPVITATATERVDDTATGKQKVTVNIEWSVPEGFEFVEAGLNRIYVTADSSADGLETKLQNLTDGAKNAAASIQTTNGTFAFNLTLSATTKVKDMYFIGYIKYKDAQGTEQVIYTEVKSSLASKSV